MLFVWMVCEVLEVVFVVNLCLCGYVLDDQSYLWVNVVVFVDGWCMCEFKLLNDLLWFDSMFYVF